MPQISLNSTNNLALTTSNILISSNLNTSNYILNTLNDISNRISTLNTDNITEGTSNLYYTPARANLKQNTLTAGSNISIDGNTISSTGASQWTTTGSNIYYNSSNIGVGVTNPNWAKLDVNTSLLVGTKYSQSGSSIIYLGTPYDASSPPKCAIIAEGISSMSRSKLHFCLDDQETNNETAIASISNSRMAITSIGDIGIGTTVPFGKLHIHNTALAQNVDIRLTDGTTGATATDGSMIRKNTTSQLQIWNFENADLYFGTSNTERLRILANGKVGIGKTPGYALDVNGEINATGLRINGTSLTVIGYKGYSVYSESLNNSSGRTLDLGSMYVYKIGATFNVKFNVMNIDNNHFVFLISGNAVNNFTSCTTIRLTNNTVGTYGNATIITLESVAKQCCTTTNNYTNYTASISGGTSFAITHGQYAVNAIRFIW